MLYFSAFSQIDEKSFGTWKKDVVDVGKYHDLRLRKLGFEIEEVERRTESHEANESARIARKRLERLLQALTYHREIA